MIEVAVVLLGAFTTGLTTYLFKVRSDLQKQVEVNTQEVLRLKDSAVSDRKLLTQKMSSVEAELKDMKEAFRDDVGEIKGSILMLTNQLSHMAEAQGELRGTVMASINNT